MDFCCHAAGLVVEVDGTIHLKQQAYEHKQDTHLTDLGLIVVRFYTSDIMQNLDTVLDTIFRACQLNQ